MRRQRQTKDEWKNTVAAQQASGLKTSEYCAKYNIHLQTFYARRNEINKKAVQTTSKLVKVLKSKSQFVSTIPPLTIIHNGLTPYNYITYLLEQFSQPEQDLERLLPWNVNLG
jgi:hypothetical protein